MCLWRQTLCCFCLRHFTHSIHFSALSHGSGLVRVCLCVWYLWKCVWENEGVRFFTSRVWRLCFKKQETSDKLTLQTKLPSTSSSFTVHNEQTQETSQWSSAAAAVKEPVFSPGQNRPWFTGLWLKVSPLVKISLLVPCNMNRFTLRPKVIS